jgi:SAM-dependent methyltransferase
MTLTPEQLFEQAQRLCEDPSFRQMIARHTPFLSETGARELDTRIHPGDQMLRHSLNIHRDPNAAYAQYFNVALQQYATVQQLLRGLFSERLNEIRVLDFACGYGRLLRFLSRSLPRDNLWASEIQADALAHVGQAYGVHTLASAADPEDFRPEQKFHLIWVASLFSHLPDRLFKAWIDRLKSCLEPDGVLCFSVHDACLLPPEYQLPESGLLFFPSSENTDLDTAIYGTTFVNQAYVEAACGSARLHRLPRALAHEQDVYVLPANPDTRLEALKAYRRGPWGWTDERELRENGELYLRGWAASIDDGPLSEVEIEVDNQLFQCPTGGTREDVARAFADPRLAKAGWEFRYHPPKGQGPIRVRVSARTDQGEMALLFAGLFERPACLTRPQGLWARLKQKMLN